ncbi:MAG: ABC transporter substrate-binding protein [Lachnospiraceae bacterium]|nr:ABC transporter substrate-binding protein [Lachnospiraceae bacterium]
MKRRAKLLAFALAAVMCLTACGGGAGSKNESGSGDENKSAGLTDLYTFETANREMENVFILNTEMANDLNVLCNTNEGLLETNNKGQLVPAIAEKWGTEDGGLTWTFNLRKGVKWVDQQGNEKADCTAQDFITGLEWVMNFHKNGANNTSMPTDMIKGAGEYYEYTKGLSAEEGMALGTEKFLEMVGIEAPDDYTLIYHCVKNAPYFDTVCTSACLFPVSAKFIEEVGVENVLSTGIEGLWYNGAYTLTEYIQNNSKTLTKNPLYWDTECGRFETVTIKIVEDLSVGYQLYETGELDHIDLSEANLRTIYDDENNKFHDQLSEKLPRKYSYQFHFNYDKHFADGSADENWNKAVANEAFRQAWYYGLDLTKYWARTNFIAPTHCENNAYTMKGLLYFSDGTEYTKKVEELIGLPESDGTTPRRLDTEKAAEFKKQAMEELSAQGVTFPVTVNYYIVSGAQNALDTANVLKQIFSECLGDDFVTLEIGTYTSSQTKEVVKPRLQSFVINGWGADYGDVQNYLGQETIGEDTAYYANNYSNINDATNEALRATYQEFTDLVNKADAINDDMDARYNAYAEAEAYMLQHALTVPAQLEVSWQLTHVNDYSRSNAMFGIMNYKYKNWETSVDAYTTEQTAKFAEEYNK